MQAPCNPAGCGQERVARRVGSDPASQSYPIRGPWEPAERVIRCFALVRGASVPIAGLARAFLRQVPGPPPGTLL